MKKIFIQLLIPCLCFVLVSCVIAVKSVTKQQAETYNHSIVDLAPDVNGRTPALDYLLDDPNAIKVRVRSLNLYDDTGFRKLRQFHPLFDE